ncbi:hypothetical protein PQI66_09460 [Corynebacterium sp. USCH3]|uniref:hypothetical protein n=1 Tax=Corynebacterium sp. USCH3 TaxID=3024840 RepID=UPI0030A9E6D4
MTGWDGIGLPGAAGLDPVSGPSDPSGLQDGYGTGDGLLLDLGDQTFGLPVSHVLPGEEAVTLSDDTGMTICADTDGDGRVDTLSVVTFDGGWSSWRRRECMTDVSEIDTDVSSVTAGGVDVGAGAATEGVGGSGDLADELRRQGDADGHVPPVTPGNGRGAWDVRGWECVDRGNWG